MTYRVKEIFYTLQGEGTHAGRAAVFCRFSGCNLWSGQERHRASAVCRFCDTDFVGTDGPGGGRYPSAEALAAAVEEAWAGRGGERFVVCTGGEPSLQLDPAAVDALHAAGFTVAVETNGTRPLPPSVDWVCLSPKGAAPVVVERVDECKLVYPQDDAPPEMFETRGYPRLLLQPMDGPDRERNTALAVRYCLEHPRWKLSLQTHKYLGIP
ncbi:MAG TPA: 7-carboxy-7-deazaguanine synthase [Acidimicrobiales bacterium]|nr:7-carboxy-7-deazaguanine synthase [Acidimicrobiales bacterium]